MVDLFYNGGGYNLLIGNCNFGWEVVFIKGIELVWLIYCLDLYDWYIYGFYRWYGLGDKSGWVIG